MRRRAFTLVEMIAAITITVLIVSATSAVVRSVSSTRSRIEREHAARQEAAAALEAVGAALRNVTRPVDKREIFFEGIDDWIDDRPADRLRVQTLSYRTVRADQPESDVREVELFVTESVQPDGSILLNMMRRTDPTRNPPPDGGGVIERVAESLVSFDLQYFDGLSWHNEWPIEPPSRPLAMRVRVEVLVDAKKKTTWAIGRLVHFPYGVQSK